MKDKDQDDRDKEVLKDVTDIELGLIDQARYDFSVKKMDYDSKVAEAKQELKDDPKLKWRIIVNLSIMLLIGLISYYYGFGNGIESVPSCPGNCIPLIP